MRSLHGPAGALRLQLRIGSAVRLATLDRRLLQLRRLPAAAIASAPASASGSATAAEPLRPAAAARATAATAAARGATGRLPQHVCARKRLAL